MELHQLRYFVQVARLESVSKASQALHISQPALSKTIGKLEDELGCQLFDRTGKRLLLNDRGRFFLKEVETALGSLTTAAAAVGETSGRISGSVSVGVFGPQMDAVSSLQEFMDAHPDIRVTLDARQRTATARVTREFDAVFYPEGPSFEGIAGIPYAHCRTLLALPSSHPLAIADSVDLAQVKDEPFIFMNTTAGTYERTYRLCLENGFSPRVRAVTSSGVAQMRFIAAGLGVGLVDAKTQQIGAPGVHLVCVRGATPDQVLCFATRPVELLSPAARELLEHLLRRFEIPNDERVVQRFSNN